MGDIFGSEETTSSSNSSNSTGSVNHYAGDSAAYFKQLYDELLSGLSTSQQTNPYTEQAASNLSNLSGSSGLSEYASGKNLDVTSNPYLQAQASAIKDNAMDNWTKAGTGINDLFNNNSFWSGSGHENALVSGAQDATRNLTNDLSSFWGNAYQNEVGNMTNSASALNSINSNLGSTGNTLNSQSTDEYNQLLSYLNSLVQSANDVQTTENTESTGTQTTEKSGLGDVIGTALGTYAGKKW